MLSRIITGLFFLLTLCQLGQAQEIKDNKLTVYGKVRVFAKADRATIGFEIKGVGNSLNAAFENARLKMGSIATQLFGIGLTKDNLSTSFFRNEENFGDKAFLSSKKDYRAIMTVTITTDKMELLEPITVVLSMSEIEQIKNVSFDLINYSQLRLDAFQKAIAAAREKARVVSAQLGIECSDVLECEEMPGTEIQRQSDLYRNMDYTPFNQSVVIGARRGFDFSTTSTSISPEELQFDSEVRIVFAIKNNSTVVPVPEHK
jgi:uncharacterized protein YggE